MASSSTPSSGPSHTHTHARNTSVPKIRLEQPLPPLPKIRIQIPETPYLDDPLAPAASASPTSVYSAYTDDEHLTPQSAIRRQGQSGKGSNEGSPISSSDTDIEGEGGPSQEMGETPQPPPPDYAPMYDYLRSLSHRTQTHTSPRSNTFLSPSSRTETPAATYSPFAPYSDNPQDPDPASPSPGRPSIIALSPLSPPSPSTPPPSYSELYLAHPCPRQQTHLYNLVQALHQDSDPSTLAEEICKFVAGLVLVGVLVIGIGFAFNWGRAYPGSENGVGIGRMKGVGLGTQEILIKSGVRVFKIACGGRCVVPA